MGLFNCMGSRRAGLEELVGGSPAGLGGPAALRCGVKAEVWGSWRVGRRSVAIPTLLNFCRRAALTLDEGEACTDYFFFSSFLPLAPRAGEGWKGELQPRARRDACPQGGYPRDYRNP